MSCGYRSACSARSGTMDRGWTSCALRVDDDRDIAHDLMRRAWSAHAMVERGRLRVHWLARTRWDVLKVRIADVLDAILIARVVDEHHAAVAQVHGVERAGAD